MMTILLDLIIWAFLFLAMVELTGHKHFIARLPDYLQAQWAAFMAVLWSIRSFFAHALNVSYILMTVLVSFFVVRAIVRLYPYTGFFVKEVPDASSSSDVLKMVVANLKYDNLTTQRAQRLFLSHHPDLLVLLEVTPDWERELHEVLAKYPYQFREVRKDPFGMVVLSKYEINNKRLLRIYNHTPTMNFRLHWMGREVDVWSLHPKPPAPTDATTSVPKDTEFDEVADEIQGNQRPTLVLGDLNDVAWSRTTRQFLRRSQLKDVRKGRGLFISFPTYATWLGFPLDQAFASRHFSIQHMGRLPHIGSDHYPMTFSFALNQE